MSQNKTSDPQVQGPGLALSPDMESKRSSLRGLGILVAAVFCLCLTAGEVFAEVNTKAQIEDCEDLLKNLNSNSALSHRKDPSKDDLSLTQVQRLQLYLEKMPEAERQELLSKLGKTDFEAVKNELAKPVGSGSAIDNSGLSELSLLFLTDLISLNDAFPGIFGLANPQAGVFKVLDLSRKIELDEKLNHPDLLKSIGLTSRFYSTLNSTLANLIQQAEVDYLGMRFPQQPTGFGRLWYRIKRFFLPLYRQVNETIQWTQEIQRQLQRVRSVDKLIVRLALSDARSLSLNDAEVDRLLKYVINSPEEIQDIEKLMTRIFGRKLTVSRAIPIGDFDIYGIAKRIRNMSLSALLEKFDKINIESLSEMNEVLSDARERRGGKTRSVKDFVVEELQIYIEATFRKVDRQGMLYSNTISENSNESYEVEESYQVSKQVPDGEDENGNPKTKTEWETHYRWKSVTPTFEDILTGSYTTGDRNVSGLDQVKARAAAMVRAETPSRNMIANAEDLINDIAENWVERRQTGKNKDFAEKVRARREAILEMLPEFRAYAEMSNQQIRNQYSKDDLQNFRDRNGYMLARLEAAEDALEFIAEAIRRDMPRLTPTYELFGFDQWLMRLKSYRNNNYWIKTGMGVVGAGGASLLHPDVMRFVESFQLPF